MSGHNQAGPPCIAAQSDNVRIRIQKHCCLQTQNLQAKIRSASCTQIICVLCSTFSKHQQTLEGSARNAIALVLSDLPPQPEVLVPSWPYSCKAANTGKENSIAKSACESSVWSSKCSTAHLLSSCLLYLEPKHTCTNNAMFQRLPASSAPSRARAPHSCNTVHI